MGGFQTHILKCLERGLNIFFSYGHPQQKILLGQEFFGYRLPNDISSKGQKTKAGRGGE